MRQEEQRPNDLRRMKKSRGNRVLKILFLLFQIPLQIFFATTAHFFAVAESFEGRSHYLNSFFGSWLNVMSSVAGTYPGEILDYTCLGLVFTILGVTIAIHLRDGVVRLTLKSVQIAALTLLPLGGEILIFDRPEFYMHITNYQSTHNFYNSFSNADLLYLSLATLAFTSAILWLLNRNTTKSKINKVFLKSSALWFWRCASIALFFLSLFYLYRTMFLVEDLVNQSLWNMYAVYVRSIGLPALAPYLSISFVSLFLSLVCYPFGEKTCFLLRYSGVFSI